MRRNVREFSSLNFYSTHVKRITTYLIELISTNLTFKVKRAPAQDFRHLQLQAASNGSEMKAVAPGFATHYYNLLYSLQGTAWSSFSLTFFPTLIYFMRPMPPCTLNVFHKHSPRTGGARHKIVLGALTQLTYEIQL